MGRNLTIVLLKALNILTVQSNVLGFISTPGHTILPSSCEDGGWTKISKPHVFTVNVNTLAIFATKPMVLDGQLPLRPCLNYQPSKPRLLCVGPHLHILQRNANAARRVQPHTAAPSDNRLLKHGEPHQVAEEVQRKQKYTPPQGQNKSKTNLSRNHCILLYSIVFYCILLYSTVFYCMLLYSIVIYCVILCSIVFYCILLHSIVFYCILLYSIVFYSILLYSIVARRTGPGGQGRQGGKGSRNFEDFWGRKPIGNTPLE